MEQQAKGKGKESPWKWLIAAVIVPLLAAGIGFVGAKSGDKPSPSSTTSSATASSVGEPKSTDKRVFSPFNKINLYNAKDDGSGRCDPSISPRPDTVRCAVDDNYIYDMCFLEKPWLDEQPVGTRVICAASPWKELKVIRLTERFLKDPQASPDECGEEPGCAWALEMSNGDHCVLRLSGTAQVQGNLTDSFQCDKGWIAGGIDGSKEPWRARYFQRGEAGGRSMAVRVAWF
jgi:hypothetical protein